MSSDSSASGAGRSPASVRTPWLVAGGLLLLAAAAGVYAANLRNQLEDVQLRLVDAVVKMQVSAQQVEVAQAQVNAVRSNLTLMTAPDALELALTGQPPATDAVGRVFISRTRGVLFAASKMPPLAPDKTFQLWYLTKGASVSAGLVRSDEQGNVTAAFDVPADLAAPTGFGVTVEAEAGASAPTTPMVLTSK